MKGERIEVFPNAAGEWQVRWKAANNETEWSTEGYTTKDSAWEAAERMRENSPEVPIYEVE